MNCLILDFCLKVSVLEEKLCDIKRWRWTPFDDHIDRFNLTKIGTGKVMIMTMMPMMLMRSSIIIITPGASYVAHWNRLRGGHPWGGPAAYEEHTENQGSIHFQGEI